MKTFFMAASMAAVLGLGGCNTTTSDFLTSTQAAISSDSGVAIMQSIGLNLGNNGQAVSQLTQGQIADGLREALRVGTQQVVKQLGTRNGFNNDGTIRIPLPEKLQTVDHALGKIGMNSLTQNLETRLNHAAELATPKAKALFLSAIQQMTLTDARSILTGSQDAATTYLRGAMGTQLKAEIAPIIQATLADAGALQAYDQVLGQYAQLPFMPDVKTDLRDYVSEKALDGIFYYVAQEEAAIRANPVKRTSEILRTVFGAV